MNNEAYKTLAVTVVTQAFKDFKKGYKRYLITGDVIFYIEEGTQKGFENLNQVINFLLSDNAELYVDGVIEPRKALIKLSKDMEKEIKFKKRGIKLLSDILTKE